MKTYYIVRSTDICNYHKYMDVDHDYNNPNCKPKFWKSINNATKFNTYEDALKRVTKSNAVGLSILQITEVYNKEEK